MDFYAVDIICLKCGERHLVTSGLMLEGGPTKAGSLAKLYGNQPLVPNVAPFLRDKVWCETEGGWVNQPDREKVFLTPRQLLE